MFKLLLVVLVVGASFSPFSHARTLELKHKDRTIYVQELKDWQLGKDLFGIPFTYFSPQTNGQRSNITFADTGANLELDVKALAQNQKDYQKGREEWAETVGASPVSFFPYQARMTSQGHRVHQIGFSYEHEGKIYFETSYYIECRGKILFSKSLRLRENTSHDIDFLKLIESIDCSGV